MKALIRVNDAIAVVDVKEFKKSYYTYYYGDDSIFSKSQSEYDHSVKDCVVLCTPLSKYVFSIEEMGDQFEWYIRELYTSGKVDLTRFTCEKSNNFEM